jgi:hypothetical protein
MLLVITAVDPPGFTVKLLQRTQRLRSPFLRTTPHMAESLPNSDFSSILGSSHATYKLERLFANSEPTHLEPQSSDRRAKRGRQQQRG